MGDFVERTGDVGVMVVIVGQLAEDGLDGVLVLQDIVVHAGARIIEARH